MTRSEKRRQWRNNWSNFQANEGFNFDRKTRRLAWKFGWKKYRDKGEVNL